MRTPTNKEYSAIAKEFSPPSPIIKDVIFAFLIGGTICAIGQVGRSILENTGLDKETVGTVVSSALIFLGAFFTAIGLYDKLAKYGGAGTLIPITGFSNAVVSPAIEFRTEGFILGVGAKMFTIAGPVIVYGASASVVYGIIYWISTLF